MGQRHQVYIVIESRKGEKEVLGIHHQWLYGRQAIHLLGNVLEFHRKSSKYGPFKTDNYTENAKYALSALYSLDIKQGYLHQTHELKDGETLDPRCGDNNDGITIIDFTGKKPKYCFMGLDEGEGQVKSVPFVPMSAEEYVRLYYPNNEKWYDSFEKARAKIDKEIAKSLKRIKAEVLSVAEVKKIFPEMFKNSQLQVA